MVFLLKRFGVLGVGPASPGDSHDFLRFGLSKQIHFSSPVTLEKWLSFLALKQYFTSDFAMEICRSLKLFRTHLPILLIFPIAHKHLLIVSCDTFNASDNCCWVWVACIPRLHTLWSTIACIVFHIKIANFKLSKSYLTCSNQRSVFTTSKLWLSTAFFFWLNKKSNAYCKCSFFKLQHDHWTIQHRCYYLLK